MRYTSPSPTGVNVAVQAGQAMAVKMPRSVPPGGRIVGTAQGLPELGHVEIELHRAPGQMSEAFEAFCDALTGIVIRADSLESVGLVAGNAWRATTGST